MNDGIFDKYSLIDDMLIKLELLADAKGVVRCGLIWDVSTAMKALKEGLKKEDEMRKAKFDGMVCRIKDAETKQAAKRGEG